MSKKLIKKIIWGTASALALCVFLIQAFQCRAAEDIAPGTTYNNLTEIFARKSYVNPRPMDLLYVNRILQPELLHFRDVQYGTHIWRISNSWNAYTFAHNHINRSPWNSDGSKVGLISNRCFSPHWCATPGNSGDPHIYLMDTTGDNFVNINGANCPSCNDDGTRFRHFVWDRFNPDYAYFASPLPAPAASSGLYRLDVTNLGNYSKVADLPNPDRAKVIYSYPSEENIVMVIDDLANNYPSPMFYLVDLRKSISDPTQVTSYPIGFNLSWPGHDLAKENSFHDIYFTRRSDGSYAFNYGPVAGLGEPIFFKVPLAGGVENVTLWYDNQGSEGIPYHSHPAWGPGGQYTAYFGEQYPDDSNSWGLNVADDYSKENIKRIGIYNGTILGGGHTAWDGYDPDFLFCSSGSGENTRLFRASVSGAVNNAEVFVNPYTGLNDTADGYHTLPRPAQSPDATKIFYHSSMTESSDNYVDSYIAVARYPAPAMNVRLENPSEAKVIWDAPTFHRETKGYHVYRSVGNANNFIELTSGAISNFEYPDAGLQSGIDYYYAVTTEEWSGLESEELSNIIRVSYANGQYASAHYEDQGRKNFDTVSPGEVQGASWDLRSAGIYNLSWTASSNSDLAYYNIYYSVEGAPVALTERLIASVPKSKNSYIDWQARTDAEGYYLVTAVDRQGNESSVNVNSDGVLPASPTGLAVQ